MNWVRSWREIFFLVFVILAVLFIHPFSMLGVQISHLEEPATQVLHVNDVITSINGAKISSLEDFRTVTSDIKSNDTITVSVLRETFPYAYKNFTQSYITGEQNNRTWISLTVKEAQPAHIQLSHELGSGMRYTIAVNGNIDAAINILSKRFSIGRITSYSFEKAGGNLLYLYTLSGDEILPLIESKGNFEAKVGNNTFFTNDDMIKVCTSGVSCSISLYPYVNQSSETSQVLWKFGFDVSIKNETAYKFVNLTKGLSISKCEGDRCLLNESIDYYLDGKYIGSEDIYSDYKGRAFQLPHVGGSKLTQQDATQALYTAQSILQGQVDANVVSSDKVSASYGPDFIVIFFAIMAVLVIAGSAVIFAVLKEPVITLISLLVGLGEIVFVLGWMAVLNVLVTPITLAGIVVMVIFTIAYKIYIAAKIKKEGISRYSINTCSSKLDKIIIIAICAIGLASFAISVFTAPLLLYFVALFILNKAIFTRNIKIAA